MDTATIFNRILFSSHMEKIHEDFKRDIEEAGFSEHQAYLKLHGFDRLAREQIDHHGIKPEALADFVVKMINDKNIHEISGLNDANISTDIKDFLKKAVEILEDSSLIGDIVPPKTLESIFPTDEALRWYIKETADYIDGYDVDESYDASRVVDFFSGMSWREIAMCDETEIMSQDSWSDFEWDSWKYINEMGHASGYCQDIPNGVFDDKQLKYIANNAPVGDLKSAVNSISQKKNSPEIK